MHSTNVSAGRTDGTRLAAGLVVSLLAHVLLVLAYRADRPARSFSLASPDEPLAVWLQPPAPRPEQPAAVRGLSPARGTDPGLMAPKPGKRADPAPILVGPGTPTPALATQPAQEQHFDMDAARLAARELADEPVITPQGRIKQPRIEPETRLARDIARADRRDCKDGIQGGLLAPLYLLMDKKDHGCKW